MPLHLLALRISLLSAALALAGPAAGNPLPDYDRQVRPILEAHCFQCHGPEKQKGGLRLDQKPAVLRGGDSGAPAVVPGNALKSHLLKLVTSKDPDEHMPPKGERLKPQEVAVLTRWVETGAHWTDAAAPSIETPIDPDRMITQEDRSFWSFVAPRRHAPPVVVNSAWPRQPIDPFVLARAEARGVAPAPEAEKRPLIRRVTFDLTGLPPTPEQVDAFLADTSSDAYEKVVDRLLASPRFGERMASLWLPLARYAEDQAHQVGSDTKFFYPYAFKYRQWVIDAFNRDLPYDRFIQLQLAADKIDGASADDLPALGFLGLGPKYYNRGRIEVMADEWEDRVDTLTRTMLGLTVACARCHDHKFDPIPARDYYALAGIFASTKMVNKTAAGAIQKPDAMADKMDPATLHVVEDGQVQDLNLFIRGNPERKGPVVPRRFLSVLSPSTPAPFKEGSGRKELALAIASRENPLTSRVMVNRVWAMLFGEGIVATPSNFGKTGSRPTHPELLDDLAVRFMDCGWSAKSLVRALVTSSTYRQSCVESASADRLFTPMHRRRLTIEQWRDSILFVAGRLDLAGGKSLELDDPANVRRTVHARISRLKLNDLLLQFDYPDANVHAESRSVTSTPSQKLFMLNSPFMLSQAKAFSARLTAEGIEADEPRVRRAYNLLFGRNPTHEELQLSLDFLRRPATEGLTRWQQYAQVLLASNEALYVD